MDGWMDGWKVLFRPRRPLIYVMIYGQETFFDCILITIVSYVLLGVSS